VQSLSSGDPFYIIIQNAKANYTLPDPN
jgi:hypothetical protein